MDLKLGGQFGRCLLRCLSNRPASQPASDDAPPHGPQGAEKLQRLLGREVWQEFVGRRVLDFGCGHGAEAVAVAQRGAEHVFGIDIQEHRLQSARKTAHEAGLSDRCTFLNAVSQADAIADLEGTIDCAYSLDSFEHYARPDLILQRFHDLLAPGGRLLISFGPPWKNPFGCHMRYFCRWPWIHLLFREETILAVRAEFRDDGARRFEDVEGGLNRMTLTRFLELVAASPFELEMFRPIPISTRFVSGPRFWHPLFTNRLTREYLTSVVLCRLVKPLAIESPATAEASQLVAVE
jgi:SAM-dependent methyltransferase